MRVLKYVAATTSRAVWNQFPGVPRHRRDVVPVAPSARWRGDSTPSTRRCPRDRNLIHWLISTQDNRTALHLGAAEGHLAAVKYLVARGADVNAVDRWRGTPLRDAEAGEHTDTVAFLKRVGAVNRRSASSLIDTPDSLSRSVWKSTSELGFLRITLVILHAIEQTQLRRQHRDDGVGRLKFDFHTGRGRALPHRSRRPPPARSGGASPSRRSEARRSRRRPRRLHQLVSSSGRRRAAAAIATQ